MSLLDIQRRHAHTWTLRLGEVVKSKDGKDIPTRLTDRMRITSPSRIVVDSFAAAFGGVTSNWRDEWQVYLPTSQLPVVVLPGQSISQAWERWDLGGCVRRCDGAQCVDGDGAITSCLCPADIAARIKDGRTKGGTSCLPVTRLYVMCPTSGVPGVGLLTTRSKTAAETMTGPVDIAQAWLADGLVVPAVLRIKSVEGRRRYAFPVLDLVAAPVPISAISFGTGGNPALRAGGSGEVDRGQLAPGDAPAVPASQTALGAGNSRTPTPPSSPRPSTRRPPKSGDCPHGCGRRADVAKHLKAYHGGNAPTTNPADPTIEERLRVAGFSDEPF